MEPNKSYSGPVKPKIDKFVQKPFTDTAAEFNALISGQGPEIGFISPVQFNSQGRLNQLGYARSDDYSFWTHGVPAMHFTTGEHPNYHRATDTSRLIEFDGLARVTDFVERVVRAAADGERVR